MDALAPLLVAIGAMPALGIAAWYMRAAADPLAHRIALHWALIALSMFVGAAGLYWAGNDQSRVAAVAILMVVAVNALAVSMILQMRRRDRGR
ncbi:hypothetical protein E2F46_04995 [Luteimonas aestuarii]|uniref:Uncharacterized protein n=1 Tax=Luteimonas aestuarii TaxID=453837 RepID=A0A4R5TXP1_9GAMM|nr:hypothetical protein [Luteimonas aestuarii]TDK25966.1 hypothetical protein E2F46_04995 [Luteimonas aestuarii]